MAGKSGRIRELVMNRGQVVFTGAHSLLYRLTDGRAGRFLGGSLLLITTTGRKTGKLRTTPLMYIRDGEDFVVVASNAGAHRDPSWWLNLKGCPEATLEIKGRKFRVRARQANPQEKRRLWSKLVGMYSGFDKYQERTSRDIPVILLTPED